MPASKKTEGVKKYKVIRDCWFLSTYWEEGQIAYFDSSVKVPEHFEFLGYAGKKPAANEDEE